MATVSHLPHVVANVLVAQAAAELTRDSERMPEVGPSFRDATRVAGSNPAIWGDIFASNREAVAAAIEDAARRLARRRRADPQRRCRGARRLARRRRAPSAAACSRPSSPAGPLRRAAGRRRQPAGHGRRAGAGPRRGRGQHRGHGAAPGAGHASGAISLWVAGEEQAAARPRAGPRPRPHRDRRRRRRTETMARFEPSGPLRGSLRPPADKSISHRAALIGAMARGPDRDRGLPRLRRHPLDPRRGRRRSAPRSRASPTLASTRAISDPRRRPARRRARRDRRRQRRHPAAPAAGLARGAGAGASGRSTATTRSGAGRSTASPTRCG